MTLPRDYLHIYPTHLSFEEIERGTTWFVHQGQESQEHPYAMDLNLFYKVLQVSSTLSFYYKISEKLKKKKNCLP